MIESPGIYQIDSATYHSDPAPSPSLSASIAHILITQSALHAKSAHPRLTENPVTEDSRVMDIGRLCHSLMLEGEDIAVIIEAENYRTKAAQEARDAARLAGKCPLLAHEMIDVHAMMLAAREQLNAHPEANGVFTSIGKSEQTLVWQEHNGIWCRARLDWLCADSIWDYKTGKRSAHPQAISRIAAASGWCLQAAFYLRGFKAIAGQDYDPKFHFVAQESFPPYALSVLELSPADLALAVAQVDVAIDTWGECLKSGNFPGYSNRVQRITSPPYVESMWLERELEEQ